MRQCDCVSQDRLRYTAVNMDSATSRTFFVNPNGTIFLLRPLSINDNFFDFTVRVSDGREVHTKSDEASVRITVRHVKFSPQFQHLPYSTTVRLDRPVSPSPVMVFTATDNDLSVSVLIFTVLY